MQAGQAPVAEELVYKLQVRVIDRWERKNVSKLVSMTDEKSMLVRAAPKSPNISDDTKIVSKNSLS